MDQVVAHAIQDFNQAAEQLVRVFKNTPEDRVAWSPSATARTPIQLVAHSAFSIGFIGEMLLGTPYPAKTMTEADAQFLEMEKGISTAEAALELLQARCEGHISLLESLTESRLEESVVAPFGLGSVPMRLAITFPAAHTRGHTSQLEYLQTIYGNRQW
jgi:hypothetical protein